MASWRNTILDNAISRPAVQQYNPQEFVRLGLIITRWTYCGQSNLDGFCIVSSDSDFTACFAPANQNVLGMGESKTPRSFISARNKVPLPRRPWEAETRSR